MMNKGSLLNSTQSKDSSNSKQTTPKASKGAALFGSSDEEDDMDDLLLQKEKTKKEQQMELQKQLSHQRSAEKQRSSPQTPMKFTPGDFVGESQAEFVKKYYCMKPPLGVGLFGTVYKARARQGGSLRAVKKIRKDHSKAKSIENLLKDVEVLKRLDHPNIIKVYEFYQDESSYYIVMEYCAGGELFDRIVQEKNFNENRAAEMMSYILSAIAYCHEKNLVHCDLKPENLMLASNRFDETLIKIIDFGNSSFREDGKMLKNKFGSVYYVAPEVLKANYNEKCDVWSLGVILYLMLSGKPPFNGNSDQAILKKVYHGKYSLEGPEWAQISNEAKELIRLMLTYDPEKRISAREALKHPWFTNNTKEKVLRLDLPIGRRSLRNLKDFRAKNKLQESILYYLVNQLTSKEEKQELMNQFLSIDTDNDGLLSKEELLKAYKKTGKGTEDAEKIVKTIMDNVDKTGSGKINYSEFVVATISKRNFFSEDRLVTAFKMFDSESKGFIGATELKSIFNCGVFQQIDENIWNMMINEFTGDDDNGKIDFPTFKAIMKKFAENEQITQSIRYD